MRRIAVLTMYSTTWCGYCHRLRKQLDREGIEYSVVDIEQDAAAADFVMGVNGGNQTGPTLRVSDGSAPTNPTIGEGKERLGRQKAAPDQQKALAPPGGQRGGSSRSPPAP